MVIAAVECVELNFTMTTNLKLPYLNMKTSIILLSVSQVVASAVPVADPRQIQQNCQDVQRLLESTITALRVDLRSRIADGERLVSWPQFEL